MEIQAIRELLRQGETGKALAAFIAFLEQDKRYKSNFLRTLRVLESNYNAVRQKELKGILPFQEAQREYNETNDALFAILDELEAGRIPAAARQTDWRRYAVPALGVLVLLLAAFFLWRKLGRETLVCPGFDKAGALHVLIVPFDPLGKDHSEVEVRIQDDISSLTAKAGIPVDVKISPRGKQPLPSLQIAERRGKACEADLVIFGQYKAFPGDSLRVKLGFSFLKEGGKTASLDFETSRDITEVKAPRDLKDALFSVCSMIAISRKNWEYAGRWMDKIREKDDLDRKMAAWLEKKKGG